jgi:hypothetical protein
MWRSTKDRFVFFMGLAFLMGWGSVICLQAEDPIYKLLAIPPAGIALLSVKSAFETK